MSILVTSAVLLLQSPVTFTFQPKVGATYNHAISMKTSQNDIEGPEIEKLNVKSKILSFENGRFKVVSTNSLGVSTFLSTATSGSLTIDSIEGGSTLMQLLVGGDKFDAAIGITFPDKPLQIGDTWTYAVNVSKEMQLGFEMTSGLAPVKSEGKMYIRNKLVSVKDGEATINQAFSGTGEIVYKVPSIENGEKTPYSSKITYGGTATIKTEISTGVTLSQRNRQVFIANSMGLEVKVAVELNATMVSIENEKS